MTDPVLQAALAADSPFLFGAIEIAFPGYTLRLLDGSGELVIGGETFVGIDPVFGVLDTISAHEEQIGEEAPELTISLLPPDDAAASELVSAQMQGSPVRIMMGAFDPSTNTIIGEPEQLFLGEIDVPTLDFAAGSRTVSYTCVSVFERLFEMRAGERAADGWHQSIWPGERGFEFVTGSSRSLYWGARRAVGQQMSTPVSVGFDPASP